MVVIAFRLHVLLGLCYHKGFHHNFDNKELTEFPFNENTSPQTGDNKIIQEPTKSGVQLCHGAMRSFSYHVLSSYVLPGLSCLKKVYSQR